MTIVLQIELIFMKIDGHSFKLNYEYIIIFAMIIDYEK